MKNLMMVAAVFGVVGLAAALVDSRPVLAEKDDGEGAEQEVSFNSLPAPIKRALKDLKVGQVTEIERERTKGGMVYEVELRAGKSEVELKLNAEGKLLGVKIEQDDDDDDDGKPAGKKGTKKRKKDRDDD